MRILEKPTSCDYTYKALIATNEKKHLDEIGENKCCGKRISVCEFEHVGVRTTNKEVISIPCKIGEKQAKTECVGRINSFAEAN